MDEREGIRLEARKALAALCGPEAIFRDQQLEAIEALVVDRRRVLCVQRTGWGKSAVYFVATRLLRSRGAGLSLIISPLLALMRNQIDAPARARLKVRAIHSENQSDWPDIYDAILENTLDALLISPERLNHPDFRDYILPKLVATAGLVVIDEAHCISDWGHDFRPDYRRIGWLLDVLPAGIPVLATTATANSRVTIDIRDQLGDSLELRGPLGRDSLRVGVISLPSSAHRLAWLADHLAELPGSGIIYALTIQETERTAAFLRSRGYEVAPYSSETKEERRAAEGDLIDKRVKALVATSALGMGFDMPDLGFVIHLGAPPSPIGYYQQIGRAGRAVPNADVILLPGGQDLRIWQYFALLSFPSEDKVRGVLAELAAASGPLSTQALEPRVELSRGQLEHMLKVLDVDGSVRRVGGGWISTGVPWYHDTARYERVSAARADEQQAMLEFMDSTTCRMAYLLQRLDDPASGACGRCDNCAGAFVSSEVTEESLESVRGFVAQVGVEIAPRVRWPTGLPGIGVALSGNLPVSERALAGRAIARLNDIGWREQLKCVFDDSEADGPASDEIVRLATAFLDNCLRSTPLVGIVLVPSRRLPIFMQSIAIALAKYGQLDLLGTLALSRPPGARGANSARRVAGLEGAFEVSAELSAACRRASGTIVLLDDFVDTRWTMTVATRALRRAGAGDVMPMALAATGRD